MFLFFVLRFPNRSRSKEKHASKTGTRQKVSYKTQSGFRELSERNTARIKDFLSDTKFERPKASLCFLFNIN